MDRGRKTSPNRSCPAALGFALALSAATFATLPFGSGCKESPAPPAPKPVVPAGSATVRGVVTFLGTAPEAKPLSNAPCHAAAKPPVDNSVLVGEGGKLQNVLVYLKDGPNVDLPAEPALLDQIDCKYEPRVVAVRAGKVLRVKSSDPTIHNVHGMCAANPQFNFGMTSADETKDVTFASAEPAPFRVKCDVHPWMTGHVGVFDHPFFAVTGADGSFALKQIPAGTYTLVAWHERLGSSEQQVTLTDGQAAAATFTFGNAAPAAK